MRNCHQLLLKLAMNEKFPMLIPGPQTSLVMRKLKLTHQGFRSSVVRPEPTFGIQPSTVNDAKILAIYLANVSKRRRPHPSRAPARTPQLSEGNTPANFSSTKNLCILRLWKMFSDKTIQLKLIYCSQPTQL